MIGSLLAVRYELQQELEGSPLFDVYRAYDRHTGRDVKVRVLLDALADEPSFLQAIRRHVADSQQLVHPGLERMLETATEGDKLFVVSEYVPASTLDERVGRLASFSVQLALATAIQVCEAVNVLHEAGQAHGDLSGRHVLVTPAGAVKVAMAMFWQTYPESSKAGLAMLRGMAPYLAPEITAGSQPSATSDVYSLGVLMYQMLSGRLPYSGDSALAIASKHASAPYPSLRATNPSVPQALDEVVKKCMSKVADERYPTAERLARDLRAIQDALRFGRPLTWPLKHGVVPKPLPVVPPVEEPDKPAAEPKRVVESVREESDGVPAWLAGIVYASSALAALALGGWVFFNLQKPRLIDLPNVVGMTQAEAAKELEKIGLQLRVERTEASESYPQGVVLGQSPQAGSRKVREHSFVYVVLSAGGRYVEVPDLKGRTVEEAARLLSSVNLQVNDQIDRVRDRELEPGLIVSQVPVAGRKLERGSRVRVKVSNGDRPTTQTDSDPYTYSLKVTMPAGEEEDVAVKIDMTDDRTTKTIYDERRKPGESFQLSAVGYGSEAVFRIFFDGELVSQVTKKAEDDDQQ